MTSTILSAPFIVIASWIALFCLIAGLGQFARKAFGLGSPTFDNWLMAFWIGYAILIAALQVWHLGLPIDWRTCLVLGALGLVGFILGISSLKRSVVSIPRLIAVIVVLAPIAFWVANRALDAQLDFDTGLYHLTSIRWLNEYPVVPGLGNLHYRLAFNQSFFMFVAALNIYPYANEGLHLANSLLMIVVIVQSVHSLIYSLRYPREFSPLRLLYVLLLPVIIYRTTPQLYSANVSSPSPDLSVFILQIVVTLAFVKCVVEPVETEQRFTLFFITALSAVGITMKLSFAVFGAAMIVLACALWLWSQRQQVQLAARQVLIMLVVVGGLIGGTWVMHGILTSGYPAFPSTFGELPVDYKIPAAIATDAADWVYSYARQPHVESAVVFSSWKWLSTWAGLMKESFNEFLFVLPCAVVVITFVIYLLGWLIFRRNREDLRLWLPLLPALLSAIFWFFSAPDPRFAGSAFWILALWSVVLLFNLIAKHPSRLIVYAALSIPVTIAVIVLVMGYARLKPDTAKFPLLPIAAMKPFLTDSGLIVLIPSNADNPLQLWDAPLPDTPYELPLLELRGNDLRDGFRTHP
ncbi:MAG: hypothetical protein ABI947_12960 [Chloroflexota bacterium]